MSELNLPRLPCSRTEATRLLCAGVHLDPPFRRRVLDELEGQRHRPVAPPLGADALPVLSHAVLAAREEARTARWLLVVWVGFFLSDLVMFWDALGDRRVEGPGVRFQDVLIAAHSGDHSLELTDGLVLPWSEFYALVALALWFASVISDRAPDGLSARVGDQAAKVAEGVGMAAGVGAWVLAAMYWYWFVSGVLQGDVHTPYPLIFPMLIACVVWRHQIGQRRVLGKYLAPLTFPTVENQPPLPPGPHYEDLRADIVREQSAALTLYDAYRPFVGVGTAGEQWSFVLELKRAGQDDGADDENDADGAPDGPDNSLPRLPGQRQGPLTPRAVLEMIKPKLEELRQSAKDSGKDRLRDLEIEEFVYLPAGVGRDEAPYDPEDVVRHREEGVDEGGEGRRVFLRIRVGAWHEQVVVTVFVRVHTQGSLLVLEVLPYVLGPVRPAYKQIDAILAELPENWGKGAIRAVRDAPAAGVSAGIGALGSLWSGVVKELSLQEPEPDVPRVSVRQLASSNKLSVIQQLDATRYLKTIQERIAEGVRDGLARRGYHTGRFEQHVYQLSGGAVVIGAMSGGAVSTGDHGHAATFTTGTTRTAANGTSERNRRA